MFKKIVVGQNERLIVVKDKRLSKVLSTGVHYLPIWQYDDVELVSTESVRFTHDSLEQWLKEPVFLQYFDKLELGRFEVGLVYKHGQLWQLLNPATTHYLWKNSDDIEVRTINTENSYYLEDDLLWQLTNKEQFVINANTSNVTTHKVNAGFVALIYVDSQLIDLQGEGEFGVWQYQRKIEVVMMDTRKGLKLDYILQENWLEIPAVAEQIALFKTEPQQVGLLYEVQHGQRRFNQLLPPNTEIAVWQQNKVWELDLVDINNDFRVTKPLLDSLRQYLSGQWLTTSIDQQHIGLLLQDGQLVSTLNTGLHAYWPFGRQLEIKQFDLRWQTVEVSGQEILTKDRVSVRVNLNANYRILDAVTTFESVNNVNEFIYRTLQLALREAIGTRNLDDLLMDKEHVNQLLLKQSAEHLSSIGIELGQLGIKDIILPGEMKEILNQVVNAQKSAEANSIKRREETAATRSLQNTAKVMEGNPTLLRLKELESLEKVAEKIDQLNVYGGLEQVMNGLVKLK
ncbi:slipin family protein [Spartinivicinus poritis]|uniref:Slipin family protein n=1 Tax=Spartinivicinus poritis TaxID=2994640 RepID=A0ABT5U739_9GAMM|nr:slipin family protein [Spartinivicinus sp. A2-2]MDE1461352.1 slipin family protein [Spartinivicinus sp. A2-2]